MVYQILRSKNSVDWWFNWHQFTAPRLRITGVYWSLFRWQVWMPCCLKSRHFFLGIVTWLLLVTGQAQDLQLLMRTYEDTKTEFTILLIFYPNMFTILIISDCPDTCVSIRFLWHKLTLSSKTKYAFIWMLFEYLFQFNVSTKMS